MATFLYRLGRFCARRARLVVVLWVALVIAGGTYLASAVSYYRGVSIVLMVLGMATSVTGWEAVRKREPKLALVAVFAVIALLLWRSGRATDTTEVKVSAEAGKAAEGEEHGEGGEHAEGEEVMLTPEAREAAGLEIEGVTERPAVALLRVTGTVETNQQQSQQATPLVGGRVERVNAALGDFVRAGQAPSPPRVRSPARALQRLAES